VHPLPGSQAVEHGAYRVVRHPIYTGVVLLLAGYGLIAGAWWSGLAAGAIAFVYVDRKAAAEERHLRAIHPGYADYCARVPKLVPWPFRRGAPR
jgi:protein-S-isoprenylcysteine O-methyltransferase Ste14